VRLGWADIDAIVEAHDDLGAVVRQAMRRNPYHPNWYWNILGRCLHTAGAFEEAIPVFERIANPQFWTYAYLAACQAALGNTEKASELKIAIKPMPRPLKSIWRNVLSLSCTIRSRCMRFQSS
jgi:hypothetical protein